MVSGLQQWLLSLEGSDLIWVVGLLTALAAGGLYGFLRYGRLLRLIADTPTARIRSVPQGFVQLEGTTGWLPGPEIQARLSGRPCVWYRYRVEETRGSGRNRRRTVVEHGTSGDLFRITDETGDCVIDPDGALVVAPAREVWYGATRRAAYRTTSGPDRPGRGRMDSGLIGGLGLSGPGLGRTGFGRMVLGRGRYRFTEERLYAHQALLAVGEFTTRHHEGPDRNERLRERLAQWKTDPAVIRRFDSSGNGELSVADWNQVRAAAKVAVDQEMAEETHPEAFHLLRRGERGSQRILLLSTLSEAQLLVRQRLRAYGSGLVFVVAASLALWAVTLHF